MNRSKGDQSIRFSHQSCYFVNDFGPQIQEMHDPAVNMPASLQVQIEGQKLTIEKKTWRTGEGYGYYGLTRVKVPSDDGSERTLLCQISAVAVEGDV